MHSELEMYASRLAEAEQRQRAMSTPDLLVWFFIRLLHISQYIRYIFYFLFFKSVSGQHMLHTWCIFCFCFYYIWSQIGQIQCLANFEGVFWQQCRTANNRTWVFIILPIWHDLVQDILIICLLLIMLSNWDIFLYGNTCCASHAALRICQIHWMLHYCCQFNFLSSSEVNTASSAFAAEQLHLQLPTAPQTLQCFSTLHDCPEKNSHLTYQAISMHFLSLPPPHETVCWTTLLVWTFSSLKKHLTLQLHLFL